MSDASNNSTQTQLARIMVRLKKLEDAVTNMAVPFKIPDPIFPVRGEVDIGTAALPENTISESPILSNIYGNPKITKFSIGTWPEEQYASKSMVIHGGQETASGVQLEMLRMNIIPLMVSAGLPFTNISVDRGEDFDANVVKSLIDGAASHLVILTPGADNYKEKLLMAYLAGRGNGNVHIITQGDSVIAADHGKNRVANVIGPYASYTERERALEVNDVLTHFTSSTGGTEHEYFDESDANFKKNVVFKDPDSLKNISTVTVNTRLKRWEDFIKTFPNLGTDIGHLVAAAYVSGMVSPSHASRFTAVHEESIEEGSKWLGMAKMYSDISPQKVPDEVAKEENSVREALQFFSHLIRI